jgi:hypothetical protein
MKFALICSDRTVDDVMRASSFVNPYRILTSVREVAGRASRNGSCRCSHSYRI